MKAEWFAQVGFLDTHRWHKTTTRVTARTPMAATRLAVTVAKARLPKGTRIHEVSVHLTKLDHIPTATPTHEEAL
jgi:Flp pilus assembly protein CpaB